VPNKSNSSKVLKKTILKNIPAVELVLKGTDLHSWSFGGWMEGPKSKF
jgi:hypothetical protein